MTSTPQYIYIVGRGRSGSTLVELILNGHPEMAAMGELEKLSLQFARDENAIYPGLCSCGSRPMECSYWNTIANDIKSDFNVDIVKNPFDFRVSDVGWEEDFGIKSPLDWISRKFQRLLRIIAYNNLPNGFLKNLFTYKGKIWANNRFYIGKKFAKLQNAKFVVDASKDRLGMRDLYDYGNGNVKIIFLTRDVFGNVWSSIKNEKRDVESATHQWVKDQNRMLKLLENVNKNDYLHVKYESICTNTEDECRRICDFLGIEYSDLMLRFDKESRHTIGGNKIRFSQINGIKQDFAWKKELEEHEIEQINSISYDTQKKLNYI
jgi:hypothetical protein